MNDSKYGRLYPERAVALAREVLQRVVDADKRTVFAGRAALALGKLDSLGFPPDEPLFLLRGQDALAAGAVDQYASLIRKVPLAFGGGQERHAAIRHVLSFADRMRAWEPRKLPD